MSCIWLAIAEGRGMPVRKSDVFVNLVHLYVEDFCSPLAVRGQFSQMIKLRNCQYLITHVRNLVAYTVFSGIYLVAYIYSREFPYLLQIENGYRSIIGLKAIKALNTLQEASLDYTREEIDQNIRVLKSKLSSPLTESDASFYDSIKKNLESIESDLTWRDPEASTVLSDESPLVQNLKTRQKRHFLVGIFQ